MLFYITFQGGMTWFNKPLDVSPEERRERLLAWLEEDDADALCKNPRVKGLRDPFARAIQRAFTDDWVLLRNLVPPGTTAKGQEASPLWPGPSAKIVRSSIGSGGAVVWPSSTYHAGSPFSTPGRDLSYTRWTNYICFLRRTQWAQSRYKGKGPERFFEEALSDSDAVHATTPHRGNKSNGKSTAFRNQTVIPFEEALRRTPYFSFRRCLARSVALRFGVPHEEVEAFVGSEVYRFGDKVPADAPLWMVRLYELRIMRGDQAMPHVVH